MSLNTQVLEILQASENAYADDALVQGLIRTDAACHQEIMNILLARNSTAGLVGIVAQYHQLDTKIQNHVREQSDQLFGVLRRCVKAREAQTRRNALDLVGRIGSYRSAYLLPLALHDRSADIRQRAAEILRELADRYFRQERITLEVLAGEPTDESERSAVQAYSLARLAEERSYLVAAIEEAVNGYEVHRRPEVAETVVWFAQHLNDALWRAIASRLSSCGRAIAELIQTATDPRMVPFIYQAFTHQDLRATVVRVVSEQRNEAFMREFIRWGFLVADTRIRRGIGGIRSLAWLGRNGQPILRLAPELYWRAVELVLATGLAVERKVAVCRDLLLSDRREAQRAGLWGLIDIENEMSTQLICSVVQWEDQELAAIAVREMTRRCPDDLPTVLAEQVASDSPASRELAGEQVTGYGFDQYWQSFDALDEDERQRLGEVLLSTEDDLLPELRSKLAGSKSTDRLRAVQIIGSLDLAGQLKEDIHRVAYDADAYVRSAVMMLLAQLPGPTSERILLNGLNDPDDRVQANSIESLDRLRAVTRSEQIRHQLRSKDNRIRANAVKALLGFQSREAVTVLLEMLNHEEPAHRASALWVVQVLKLMALSARVLRLAKHDPDPTVRRRALRAVTVLNSALKGETPNIPSPAETVQEGAP